ncbi:hypothetical protein BJY24_001418 [Nocardia transvalensis]|uniref:Uncharacterized protein n=1 Tax=Nocardia transvalensis TaxID=37333 RepID=A0A7W9PAL0_9NOCA|nr:hypothetical protein [Nocardia transvalensis]MBB5912551.1 hypothetical protein [Nocardia transvalensis]
MGRPRAIGYLRRDVSRIRQRWDEEQIRSLAALFGYDLAKTVTFGPHTDRPVARLCVVVVESAAVAVFTPSVVHFDGGVVPGELIRVADVVTVDDHDTYASSDHRAALNR